jgi:hypothetical protein
LYQKSIAGIDFLSVGTDEDWIARASDTANQPRGVVAAHKIHLEEEKYNT